MHALVAALTLAAAPALVVTAESRASTQEQYDNSPFPATTCPDLVDVTASSTLAPQGEHSYDAEQLLDGDLGQAWVEGKKGLGEGEWVELKLRPFDSAEVRFTGEFTVFDGLSSSEATWRANSRVKRLRVSINGTVVGEAELADQRYLQHIALPEGQALRAGDRVRFEVVSVTRGTKYEDTALSELVPQCQFTPREHLAPATFMAFAGLRFGDVEQRVRALYGPPEKVEPYKDQTVYLEYFHGGLRIGVDAKTGRVETIRVGRHEEPLVRAAAGADAGATDAQLRLLGRQLGEVSKTLGAFGAGNRIEADCSTAGRRCRVSLTCYGFNRTACDELATSWGDIR